MAITAFVGLPGHGKSYSAIKHAMLPALEKGRTIVTNIPVYRDVLDQDFDCELYLFDIEEARKNDQYFFSFPAGSVFLIDECAKLWPAGLMAKDLKRGHFEFLKEHRHISGDKGSTQIFLIEQNLDNLSKPVRSLCESTTFTKKRLAGGMENSYKSYVCEGPILGTLVPEKKILSTYSGKYEQKVYKYYKSQSRSESHTDETRIDERMNIFKNKKFMSYFVIGFLLFIFLFFLAVKSFVSLFSGSEVAEEQAPKELHEIQAAQAAINRAQLDIEPDFDFSLPSSRDKVSKQDFQNMSLKDEIAFGNKVFSAFFSLIDYIDIVANIGYFPRINYKYRVVFDDSTSAVFTNSTFINSGFRIKPISQCAVLIYNEELAKMATCSKFEDTEKPSLFDYKPRQSPETKL